MKNEETIIINREPIKEVVREDDIDLEAELGSDSLIISKKKVEVKKKSKGGKTGGKKSKK